MKTSEIRERCDTYGAHSLTDAELVALVAGWTAADALSRAKSALSVAQGGLGALVSRRATVGSARLRAALEIAVRAAREAPVERAPLANPAAVAGYLALRYLQFDQEVMGALYLDTRNRLLADRELFRGTLNRAAVEPRQILRAALELGAAGMVIFHTHPSGDPGPSAEDLAFTRRLAEAGETVGVRLVDHLIVGGAGRWVSLRERGAW